MRVLVAMPCYGGQLHVAGQRTLLGIKDAAYSSGIDIEFLVVQGESAITRGRSNICATFLAGDWDVLAMLDADILLEADDFLRLLALDRPVRGAAVALKTLDMSECLSAFVNGEQVTRATMPKEPFEVHYLGGSVLLIERFVLNEMAEHYEAELGYDDPINGPGVHLFCEIVQQRTLLSEDYAFCYRARECGFRIWCDPRVIVTHFDGRVGWRN